METQHPTRMGDGALTRMNLNNLDSLSKWLKL